MMRRFGGHAAFWLICGLLCIANGSDIRGDELAQRGPRLSPPQSWRDSTPRSGTPSPPAPSPSRNGYRPPVIQPGQYPPGPAIPHRGQGGAKRGYWNSRRPTYPVPIIAPQIYGYPPPTDPATLGNQIEIVPNGVPLRSRSSATYQVVPADPPAENHPDVEVLPSPTRPEYFELPPPLR